MFDDMLLAQSAVDRFRNNAYDLVVDGESYRPIATRADYDSRSVPG
jgi:hypothetical protein